MKTPASPSDSRLNAYGLPPAVEVAVEDCIVLADRADTGERIADLRNARPRTAGGSPGAQPRVAGRCRGHHPGLLTGTRSPRNSSGSTCSRFGPSSRPLRRSPLRHAQIDGHAGQYLGSRAVVAAAHRRSAMRWRIIKPDNLIGATWWGCACPTSARRPSIYGAPLYAAGEIAPPRNAAVPGGQQASRSKALSALASVGMTLSAIQAGLAVHAAYTLITALASPPCACRKYRW